MTQSERIYGKACQLDDAADAADALRNALYGLKKNKLRAKITSLMKKLQKEADALFTEADAIEEREWKEKNR